MFLVYLVIGALQMFSDDDDDDDVVCFNEFDLIDLTVFSVNSWIKLNFV